MANRLARETSPYLLQHRDNPVDWYPWGQEAQDRARELDRPILLSVGYSACHWCHVMERESFEDAATAAYMNEHFVNVKVDREERPDVDALCAGSEGEEGRFYVWTPAQIRAVLGAGAEPSIEFYGVTESGNFEGRNILHLSGGASAAEPPGLAEARRALCEARAAPRRAPAC